MIAGISGTLLSIDALARVVPRALAGDLGESSAGAAHRRIRSWHRSVRGDIGPVCSPRAIFDRVAEPLCAHLGYAVRIAPVASAMPIAALLSEGARVAALTVVSWRSPGWREGVRAGLALEVDWCLCVSGPELIVVDARRAFARRELRIDLAAALEDPRAFALVWGLLRAEAMRGSADSGPLMQEAVRLSEKHRGEVRTSLQAGVHEALVQFDTALRLALRSRRLRLPRTNVTFRSEALVIVYRILFLLFAEARGLVPSWHVVYRRSYTIESLRDQVERLSSPPGLWEALQAIARLAHHGCHAGTLTVEPFNGPLFAPSQAPLAERLALNDGLVREGVLALTTRCGRGGRERIAYSDLGVEQLGGVYERLLDDRSLSAGQGRRRETGSFYTPRPLTEFVVRRTLAPLVADRSPEEILSLRVLDPAMGSGAFLVAACRFLATAYERALIDAGECSPDDVGDGERASFRRLVAQRCLFGVDVNPMAVHLARLSLWLATLAAGKPLTFLDHHLRTGNSLVGASPDDVRRRQPGREERAKATGLPLLEEVALEDALGTACGIRVGLAVDPGDTVAQVRAKERTLARLRGDDSELRRWQRVADLWCAGWFLDRRQRRPFRQLFASLADGVLGRDTALPPQLAEPWLETAGDVAAARRFFHWQLEFPEVFYDAAGHPRPEAGFDAVLGNPPWEMLRNDEPDGDAGAAASRAGLGAFARGSGVFTRQGDGHTNLYHLFVERMLSLVRRGGRVGVILPSGFAIDHGCARLRRDVLDRVRLDTFTVFENRAGVFPIHRSLKFLLATGTRGEPAPAVPLRTGVRSVDTLETLADDGVDPGAVLLSRAFLEQVGGGEAIVPDIRSAADRELVAGLMSRAPALGDARGWQARFGRELNATEDRALFSRGGDGLPVLEGKHLRPFAVDLDAAPLRVAPAALAGRSIEAQHPRLAYRDVSSPSNRLTLIAAVVPPGTVTTHTVFCMRGRHRADLPHFLCGVLNSFVANYLVRLRVSTHVTVAAVEWLPVPVIGWDTAPYQEIAGTARRLGADPDDSAAAARLQAAVARLYGLSRRELEHVLGTFPLVDRALVDAVLAAFTV